VGGEQLRVGALLHLELGLDRHGLAVGVARVAVQLID